MIHLKKAIKTGNKKAGEIHREALLKLHPQDERVQLWVGNSLYYQAEYRKALTHFKKAKRLNESFHLAYNILGYTYMNLGKPEKAEEYFKAYLRMLPDAANPHDSYAEFLRKQGRFDEAIEHYTKAINMMKEVGLGENTNENTENLSHLLEFSALTSNGDLAKAENARQKCEKRLSKNGKPNDWQRYYRMWGILEIKKGNYRQARKYLAKSYEHPMKWYYTGLAWEKSGNQRKARKWYEKVAKHYSNTIDLGIFRKKAMAGLEE